jgi:D-alanine-D-alanine ligase
VRASWEVAAQERLAALERSLVAQGRDVALFLVYDRPTLLVDRPGLAKAFFAERCVSDAQINETIEAFRSVGAYVELFENEWPLLEALATGRIQKLDRPLKVVYNGLECGVTPGGFEPGRKSLVAAVADSYGLPCANSNAYVCALTLHKFHYATVLRALGIPAPRAWHYRLGAGWIGGSPPDGTKVIVKSTYEAWSVGVSETSVFQADSAQDARVERIACEIGQPVTVQEFVAGMEVSVPIYACPDIVVTPPVKTVLAKSPGDVTAVMTLEDNITAGAVTYDRFDGEPAIVERLKTTAVETFGALELSSFGRVDFRVDESGQPWVIDVAVSPGMSSAGSAFSSLALLGFDHARFLRIVIASTLGARGLLASPPQDLEKT